MSVDVTTETGIARPVDEVAAHAAGPSNAPGWHAMVPAMRRANRKDLAALKAILERR